MPLNFHSLPFIHSVFSCPSILILSEEPLADLVPHCKLPFKSILDLPGYTLHMLLRNSTNSYDFEPFPHESSFRFALPPFFLCPEMSTFVGGGSVLITAALYGVLAIGKKYGLIFSPIVS